MRASSFLILQLLSDGAFHAGAALGSSAGCSRANVWHAVRELEEEGLRIFKVRGRGYKLADAFDLLDEASLRAALARLCPAVDIEILEQCASTNAELLARAAAGAPSGSAVACELQSAGRGRRGNRWVTPLGGGLAFSLLWRFEQGASGLAGLSLASGVACVRALTSLGASGIGLKWPNDIVHHGRKLGGALIEVAGENPGPSAIVCGIGLNTRLGSGPQAQSIDQPATDLANIMSAVPSRNALLAALLAELAAMLEKFARHGFAAFRDEWLHHHAFQGECVRLALGEHRALEGRALGVSDDGALLLEHGGTVGRFYSGDLSLRRAA